MPLRSLLAAAILVVLSACGKESPPPPQQPQLSFDRDSIGFGLEFDRPTFIGTRPQETLILQNTGLDDLVITSATIQGDSAFTISAPTELTLAYKKRSYIQIIFAPTEAKSYSATITVVSNAQNTPAKLIPVTGRGVPAS